MLDEPVASLPILSSTPGTGYSVLLVTLNVIPGKSHQLLEMKVIVIRTSPCLFEGRHPLVHLWLNMPTNFEPHADLQHSTERGVGHQHSRKSTTQCRAQVCAGCRPARRRPRVCLVPSSASLARQHTISPPRTRHLTPLPTQNTLVGISSPSAYHLPNQTYRSKPRNAANSPQPQQCASSTPPR
jgi:hypothetical protein